MNKTSLASKKRFKVMIVEDDTYLLKAMHMKFTQEGFTTKIATSAEEGLRMLKTWVPEVIVLDILLPGANGYEFLRIIKEDPKLKRIAVIISSNLDEDITAGPRADQYIVKSNLDLDNLALKVAKLARRNQLASEKKRHQ